MGRIGIGPWSPVKWSPVIFVLQSRSTKPEQFCRTEFLTTEHRLFMSLLVFHQALSAIPNGVKAMFPCLIFREDGFPCVHLDKTAFSGVPNPICPYMV